MFNLSFKTGSIPAEWKLAHIVPIHKKGDKNNIENYRPISLTCIISKIFEKSIRDALLNYCREYIHDSQHGFLPQKSCTTQLVPFSHDISLGLNENKLIDIIYFDFAKAFDSVNHEIILNKLKNEFNVNGLMLKFVKEYLQGRKQRVTINGVLSNECPVVSGVPQGSILGPPLFVLFINNMHDKVSQDTKVVYITPIMHTFNFKTNKNGSLSDRSRINGYTSSTRIFGRSILGIAEILLRY